MLTKPYNLLIIDDEEEVCELLSEILEREFQGELAIQWTSSSIEAESIMELESIQLVITDMNMPGSSGYDIVKKSLLSNKSTGVIVFTGNTSLATCLTCFRDGAFALLTKPLNVDRLVEVVRAEISRLDNWYHLFQQYQVKKT